MVSIYELDEEKAFAECSVLRFESADEAWLDFVSENRAGNYEGKVYDFIFGPVANDDVYTPLRSIRPECLQRSRL